MNVGTLLKTKVGPSATKTEYYSLWATKGAGLALIGKVAERTTVGTWLGTAKRSGKDYTEVQLANPVVVGGLTYKTAYIETQWLYAVTLPTSYYCTAASLNIRSSATSASLSNVVAHAKKGELVGVSEGVERNGFLYLQRPNGSYAWASKSYLTTKSPVTGKAPVVSTDATSPQPGVDPQLNHEPVSGPLENLVGTTMVDWVKWGAVALIVVVAIVSIAKIWRKPKKHGH